MRWSSCLYKALRSAQGKRSGLLTPQLTAFLTPVIQSHCWPLSFLLTLTPSSQGQPAFSLAVHALSHNSASRASEFPLSGLSGHVLGTYLHVTLGPRGTSFSIYSLNQKQVLAATITPILSVRGYDKVSNPRLVSALPYWASSSRQLVQWHSYFPLDFQMCSALNIFSLSCSQYPCKVNSLSFYFPMRNVSIKEICSLAQSYTMRTKYKYINSSLFSSREKEEHAMLIILLLVIQQGKP